MIGSAGKEGGGDGGGDSHSGGSRGGGVAVGEVQPLSRAKRLHQQSNMSFWLILKKKNDLQAKAARVQELRAMLEKIRCPWGVATGFRGGVFRIHRRIGWFSTPNRRHMSAACFVGRQPRG